MSMALALHVDRDELPKQVRGLIDAFLMMLQAFELEMCSYRPLRDRAEDELGRLQGNVLIHALKQRETQGGMKNSLKYSCGMTRGAFESEYIENCRNYSLALLHISENLTLALSRYFAFSFELQVVACLHLEFSQAFSNLIDGRVMQASGLKERFLSWRAVYSFDHLKAYFLTHLPWVWKKHQILFQLRDSSTKMGRMVVGLCEEAMREFLGSIRLRSARTVRFVLYMMLKIEAPNSQFIESSNFRSARYRELAMLEYSDILLQLHSLKSQYPSTAFRPLCQSEHAKLLHDVELIIKSMEKVVEGSGFPGSLGPAQLAQAARFFALVRDVVGASPHLSGLIQPDWAYSLGPIDARFQELLDVVSEAFVWEGGTIFKLVPLLTRGEFEPWDMARFMIDNSVIVASEGLGCDVTVGRLGRDQFALVVGQALYRGGKVIDLHDLDSDCGV